jgi:hypothetical protein
VFTANPTPAGGAQRGAFSSDGEEHIAERVAGEGAVARRNSVWVQVVGEKAGAKMRTGLSDRSRGVVGDFGSEV